MRLVVFLCVLVFAEALVGEFDSDLANVGQYITADGKPTYRPYAPLSPDPTTGWDYQVEGGFTTHGKVMRRFFMNNQTKSMRNCFRTIGGKACNPEYSSRGGYMLKFANRFEEVYVCLTGLNDVADSANTRVVASQDIFFAVYVPRFTNSIGLDDPIVGENRDLSGYINGTDRPSSPRTLSMLLQYMIGRNSGAFLHNTSFFEVLHWDSELLQNKNCPSEYFSYNLDGTRNDNPMSGDLQGLIRFNVDCKVCAYQISLKSHHSAVDRAVIDSNMGCDECEVRPPPKDDKSPETCPDGWSKHACLFGFSKFINVPLKCALVQENAYSIRCMDPARINDYIPKWIKLGQGEEPLITGVQNFFFRGANDDESYLSTTDYGNLTTVGYVAFPSWNEDLGAYFDPNSDAGVSARLGNRHYASIRTIYPFLHIPIYKSQLKHSTGRGSWGTDMVDGAYWNLLGRVQSDNAVSMNCPKANNSAPGVHNETCNMGLDNANACMSDLGRCFCDFQWMGIACDIPIPADIRARTSDPLQWLEDAVDRSADQGDPFQICSTAGKFSADYTVFYLPFSPTESRRISLRLCECMPGFEGRPDDAKTFVPVYASLFHPYAASRFADRAGVNPSFINLLEWFSSYMSDQFKTDTGKMDTGASAYYDGTDAAYLSAHLPRQNDMFKVYFNWHWYILKHQCLIWKQPAYIPPLNVYWDYESFSFAQPNGLTSYKQGAIYPWPPISTTNRQGKQGIRCMNYRAVNCVTSRNPDTDPLFYTCSLLTFLYNGPFTETADHWAATGIQRARLYGGDDCSVCPECNTDHSDCVTAQVTTPVLQWVSEGICKATLISSMQTYVPGGIPFLQLVVEYDLEFEPQRFIWHSTPDSDVYGVYQCSPQCSRNDDLFKVYDRGSPNVKLGDTLSPDAFCHTQVQIGTTTGPQNICKCDPNFCGPTCDTQICASTSGAKVCGNGTCVLKPGVTCGYAPDGLVFPGVCKCDNGWEGTNCDTPICPFDSNGNMCAGRGTCDPVSRTCVCYQPDVDGGPVCNQPACPRFNGLECSGAVAYGTQSSVCDHSTRKCKCYETLAPAVIRVGLPGWESTDIAVQWTGKWGEKCEHDYADVCRNPVSKKWCSQPIDSNGVMQTPISDGYGGCYNTTCQQMGTGAAGLECRPSCKCTLEFTTDPYCEISICGHDRCGAGGTCVAECTDTNSQSLGTCPSAEAILNGVADVRADCVCNKVVNGQFFAAKVDGDPCDTPAPTCYTGSSSPCNGNGDCVWNSTHFVCHCHPNHFGSQCEITPQCQTPLGGPCSPPAKCSSIVGSVYCVCPVGYLRDANRLCNQERCLSTLGKVAPGNDTCLCPRGLPFHAIPDFLLDKVGTQTKLGCRKGCPINPVVSIVECGANEQVTVNGASVNRSRCIDLMNNDPIYWDDARPAPVCNCSFFARDAKGGLNYFIDDGNGGCKPKCNLNGTCSGTCTGPRIDPVTLACQCVRGWEGPNCDVPSCNGNQHHSNLDGTGPCVCKAWCRTGDKCDVDLCQATGGVCAGAGPNDCDCSGNDLLKLNNSVGSRRMCVSACQNGGVLNSDKSQCLCPQPYTGRWCQTQQTCNIQFAGSFCNISQCLNGGVPRPNTQVGCICSDRWYQGQLCETDMCVGRMYRSAGSCICKTGWSGTNCDESTCLPGGEPDPVTGFCNCKRGYNRTADNIGCSVVTVECVHGQLGFRGDGSQFCSCEYNYTGLDCSTEACALPFIVLSKNPVDNTATCGCPPTLYGPQCEETYCSTGSWFNPKTNTTECKCPVGYQLAIDADSTGTRQCVPNPHICDREGTLNWNNDANQFPCQCKQGYTGDHCTTPVEAASTSGGGISAAEIGGIVGGAVATLLIIGGSFFCFKKLGTLLQTKMKHRKKNYVRIRTES